MGTSQAEREGNCWEGWHYSGNDEERGATGALVGAFQLVLG